MPLAHDFMEATAMTTQASAIDYTARLASVQARLDEPNLDALLVFGSANRRYLSGFTTIDTTIGEYAGSVLVLRDRAVLLVSPLYADQAKAESGIGEPVELQGRMKKLLPERLKEWGVRRLGFERDYTLYGLYEDIAKGLPDDAEMIPVENFVEDLRLRKDAEEQEALRRVARIADEAYERAVNTMTPGILERDLARRLDEQMVELGADGPAFGTIVAAGANSARPHHEPGGKPLEPGDAVVIDMGARLDGYCSDMTRSFSVGVSNARYDELYALVLDAHNRSKAAVRRGASGKDVDAVARELFKDAGYETEFSHSLGHGLGLDVHERPSLGKESEDTLEAGMVVTIEPGLYFGGWGGIRIEDSVIVTEDGSETLNHALKTSRV